MEENETIDCIVYYAEQYISGCNKNETSAFDCCRQMTLSEEQ